MIVLKGLRVENFKLLRQVELAFPRQGSILIEGLNESGKSTLFESVFYALYGTPLVMEGRGKGNLESAIRYGADAASVELLLGVEDTELEIRRTLRRGKPSQASLVVRRPDAPEERIVGVQAVNGRVVEELGGLDAEALLNSCFVEQKKLSKLEDLAAGQRRESVRRLLNLDRLTTLADGFKVTVQDERALAEARDRLDLAEVAAGLPELSARKAELESHLGKTAVPGAFPSHGPEGSREHSESIAQLEALRGSARAARRRAALLAAAGLLVLVAAGGLALAGVLDALWASPAAVALMLLCAASFRSARDLEAEVGSLEMMLNGWRDTLLGRIGDLEGRRARAEERLGVRVADLELEECRRRVKLLARRIEVKRRAAALVEGTMERIVRMVLPDTERNLARILPLLTAGRYHEARIGEDYQIQVWDDLAGRYVSKSLFSGGARDQFSLALRLAFAMATLPQELGAAPGFVFLDEPLSSFDVPRTEALVGLLTTGLVATCFSQLFVISHSRSFDAGAFQYRLVMRDGRVAESNLPPAQ